MEGMERSKVGESTISDTFNLPEECVAQAISLTSPRDACRLSAVSSAFRSAAEADTVWEKFLPSDYPHLLSQTVDPVPYSSQRELYFLLCQRPVLIDSGKMSFGLEKSSGKKCFMLSARALSIVWGDTPQVWRWITLPDSRFSEVAELLNVYWLEIRGKFQSKLLSCKTKYAAYLVFKVNEHGRSFSFQPQETAVVVGGCHVSSHTVSIAPDPDDTRRNTIMFRNFLRWRGVLALQSLHDDDGDVDDDDDEDDDEEIMDYRRSPRVREDGWMEMELGDFYVDEGDEGEIDISFMEVKGRHCKRGLIVQGIEIRPRL